MERPKIDGQLRSDRGKNAARRVRRSGRVPAVLYGGGDTVPLTVDPRQIIAALRSQAGHNTIFDLVVEGSSSPAMVVESQFEPVHGGLLHLDLKRIAMDKRLRVSVPIVTTGDSKGVKTQGGILEIVLREVEVECLPGDIPERIAVAVDALEVNQGVRLADLQQSLGEKGQILGDPATVICHVILPKAEEAAVAAEAEAAEAAAEPEVIKKGKGAEEGEEAAEASSEKAAEKGKKKE